MTTDSQPLIDCRNVQKMFPDPAGVPFAAVDGVSFRLSAGEIVGLLGPDGAGKTTLIRLITGLMKPHGGSISVLNLDSVKKSRAIQASIGYMPQKFGLYEDLTVQENMELYARMHGVYGQDREKRFRSLLSMTNLERFTTRLAGKLSGGMKQKLGLCCSLVSSPPLILLDEPTVGVDPLSRRELWNILKQFSGEEGVGVLVSTSYMDESAYCNRTLIMYEGRLLMDAPPSDVIARAEGMCVTVRTPEGLHARQFQSRLAAVPGIINATPQGNTVRIIVPPGHPAREKLEEYHPKPAQPDFSDGFMTLLADQMDLAPQDIPVPAGPPEPEQAENGDTVIQVTDLVRKFGSFIAVNRAAGPQRGRKKHHLPHALRAAARQRRHTQRGRGGPEDRRRAGAQESGIRGPEILHVRHAHHAAEPGILRRGLRHGRKGTAGSHPFHGRGIPPDPVHERPRRAPARRLQAAPQHGVRPPPLPGHPLSGRTHFRRGPPGPAGLLAAHQRPGGKRRHHHHHHALPGRSGILRQHAHHDGRDHAGGRLPGRHPQTRPSAGGRRPRFPGRRLPVHHGGTHEERRGRSMIASLKRIGALIVKELHQVVRDPGNVGIAVILPAVLLLLFGYGMSMDIKNVRIAYLAVPASSQSTELETRLTLSRYFQTARVFSTREAEEKLRTHEADAFIALQSDAPDTLNGGVTKVQIVVNGVNANQATLIRNYLQAVVGSWAASLNGQAAPVLDVQTRTRFNEANDSHYYLVPGVIVTIMTMIGALLTSLVMAREYERGTLESLFVTPVGSGEILTAKAATNFLLGMVSLAISMIFAAFVFDIPIRGSLILLLAVSALFLIVALGLGLVISTATKNQFLACQFAIMGTFMPALMLSGFLYDILNMPPAVRAITYIIPARYYVTLLQTLFLAGDIPSVIIPCCITLGVFAVVLMGIARLKAPKSLE